MTCEHGTAVDRHCLRCLADWSAAVERFGPYDEFVRAARRSTHAGPPVQARPPEESGWTRRYA